MESLITLKDVNYYYKSYDSEGNPVRITGVDNINAEFYEGEFVAVVGHNGSGKSTLAKLLNGLLLPRHGDVFVMGKNTKEKNNLFEIHKSVGMVFQNPDNQMVASIVEEDVAFGPENLAVPQKEIVQRVKMALTQVGMEDYASVNPHKLSGGQKQRVAIAGALAIQPKVLILDESTAMLDPLGRKEVLSVAKTLNKELKMTIILITHFMEEAQDADRVLVMKEGNIIAAAPPQEIFSHRELIQSAGLMLPRAIELAQLLQSAGVPLKDTYFEDAQSLGEEICKLM